jgi:uncharacterized protein YoxC
MQYPKLALAILVITFLGSCGPNDPNAQKDPKEISDMKNQISTLQYEVRELKLQLKNVIDDVNRINSSPAVPKVIKDVRDLKEAIKFLSANTDVACGYITAMDQSTRTSFCQNANGIKQFVDFK